MMKSYLRYMKEAVKSTPQVYGDYLYRRISYPVSFLFFLLGFSPNAITLLGIVLSIISAPIFVISPLFGILMYMVAYLLDFCDGNIARVMNKRHVERSKSEQHIGLLLESLQANVMYFSFTLALSLYISVTEGSPWYLLIGFVWFGSKMVTRYAKLQTSKLYKDAGIAVGYESIIGRYKRSLTARIKFFFTKVFFTANLYFILYFIILIAFPDQLTTFFLAYVSAEVLYMIFSIVYIFIKAHRIFKKGKTTQS